VPGEAGGGGRALAIAWRALSRRDRTVAELRDLLERRGARSEEIDAALAEVAESGYLDDAEFARRFTDDRRRLDGWGERRIAHELARRGVPAEVAEAALGEPSPEAELDAARAVLRDRVGVSLSDDRARRRAFALLVRRGYAAEVVYEAIRG